MFIALPTTVHSTEEQHYTYGLPLGNLETISAVYRQILTARFVQSS